jgi:hypothetical protein
MWNVLVVVSIEPDSKFNAAKGGVNAEKFDEPDSGGGGA